MEIGQLAAGFQMSLKDTAAQVADAGLVAQDEPDPMQLLLVMGVNTSSVWMDGLLRIVALVEMEDARFKAARETGTLRTALDHDAATMEDGDVADMRIRASAAMEHLAAQSGVDAGKAWGVLGRSVWQALEQAAEQLRTIPSTSSSSSSPPNSASSAT